MEAIGFGSKLNDDVWKSLFNASVGSLLITLMGSVPGYWFTVFLIDRMGRKTIQLMGFFVLTILFLILGIGFDPIKKTSIFLFVVIFVLMQFFLTFGPNPTTFVIPSEVFPTRYRSTAYGISAALGKLGAVFSQVVFCQMKDLNGKQNNGIPLILIIMSVLMFAGFILTFLLPETKGRTLEEINQED